ncbi:MAG: F0F1 ATP synthase subunit epsilon [Acidobacteria bacterium]|jgi:F-type H+-transporting ATPase subunit epsilon|nr:MAG: F0F1 ATP synthase subunit epsilon [Acidobacteriota bacterium]GIU82737.1 MAG: ATP synthase epsilon chain [Pyrinomonadaceae bacterium]
MLRLEIVTPEKKVLSESVDMVTIPTASGEIGVLPNHAPLISSLKPGILTYFRSGVSNRLVVAGGFVEINDNKVSVLADIAETADEIDVEKARLQKEESEKILSKWSGSQEELEKEREKLECAQARLQLATGKIS